MRLRVGLRKRGGLQKGWSGQSKFDMVPMFAAWAYNSAVIPCKLKIAHTCYLATVVLVYYRFYGPQNFLWFSDLALIGLAPALWREDRRLTSMLAITVLVPEILWNIGFFTRLLTGRELFGLSFYMFDQKIPLGIRALALFHVWLPLLLVWAVKRLGYDRKAFLVQVIVGEAVIAATYALTQPEQNINWVYGPGGSPQHAVSPGLYLCAVMIGFPLFIWWPTHAILKRLL